MFIRELRTKHPEGVMNAVATVEQAREIAITLEKKERARGLNASEARSRFARRLGVASGTIENLVRGRLKRVDAWLRDRLQAVLIRELETEIARLTHELEMARQSGARPASDQMAEIEAHLSAAKALLSGGENENRS